MKSSHQLSGNTNRLDREDDCYADLHPGITVTATFFSPAARRQRAVRRDPPADPQ